MQYWADRSWNIKDIFDRALKYHASVFNNKSSIVPKDLWGLVNAFLRKMGYQFALRRIQMPEEVKSGTTMAIEILWENIGVSLSYHRFQLAYQIKNGKNTMEHISKANIRSHFRIQN